MEVFSRLRDIHEWIEGRVDAGSVVAEDEADWEYPLPLFAARRYGAYETAALRVNGRARKELWILIWVSFVLYFVKKGFRRGGSSPALPT